MAYFSQIGEQIEFRFNTNPCGQEHFSGATHTPNSQGFVHFGLQLPSEVNS